MSHIYTDMEQMSSTFTDFMFARVSEIQFDIEEHGQHVHLQKKRTLEHPLPDMRLDLES
jgi:hypothetical protein